MAAEDIGGIKGTAELDVGPLQEGIKQVNQAVQGLNASTQQAEGGLNKVEQASKKAGDGLNLASVATKALGTGLGLLGAQSIDAVIYKIANLSREAVSLSINFQGVENRAKAIFGTSFPQMQAAADKLATSFGRSKAAIMDFMTGFGTIIQGVGASAQQVNQYSQQLTSLTVVLGKAHPELSDAEIYDKISMGIEGNIRGLRSLGVIMSQKALQDEADRIAGGLKVKDMTDEQLVMLRTQFLLEQTTKQQQAGADATGQLGDTIKDTTGKWKDFLTAIGTDVTPYLNATLKAFLAFFQGIVAGADATIKTMQELLSLGQYYGLQKQEDQLAQHQTEVDANIAFQTAHGIGLGKARKKLMPGEYDSSGKAVDYLNGSPDTNFWANQNAKTGAGGANKILEEGKQLKTEIDKLEKDILDSLGKQAAVNLKRLTQERDELEFKQKTVGLTKSETAELNGINSRIAFGKDKIKDLTDAWTQQVEVVKKAREEVQKLNDDIVKQGQDLQDRLAKIDEEGNKQKSQKIADLIKEQGQLNDRLAAGQGLSAEQQKRLQQIGDEITKAKAGVDGASEGKIADLVNSKANFLSSIGGKYSDADKARLAQFDSKIEALKSNPDVFTQGQNLANADDLSKIDLETQQKKKDAAIEGNKKLQETTDKLTAANAALAQSQRGELAAQNSVIIAMDSLRTKTDETFTATDNATTVHVTNQIAVLMRLQAQLDAVANSAANVRAYLADPENPTAGKAPIKRAGGGMVYGPGGPTGDMIPALLSDGEGIIKTSAVNHYGGPGFIHAINSLALNLPRFATGGVVSSVNNSRAVNVTVNNHGEAARVMAHPSMLKFHARYMRG